ncbi:MAG: hypothetical protein K8F60_07915 [Melioribacteraceae bacterium]|nr:hypothetical protein [Melioribacteraceae bacterium]
MNLIIEEYNLYKVKSGAIFLTPIIYIKYFVGKDSLNSMKENNFVKYYGAIIFYTILYLIIISYYSFLYLVNRFYITKKSKSKRNYFDNQIISLKNENKILINSDIDFKQFWKEYGLSSDYSNEQCKKCLKLICDELFSDVVSFEIVYSKSIKKLKLHKSKVYEMNPDSLINFEWRIEINFLIDTINDYYNLYLLKKLKRNKGYIYKLF